MLQNLPELAVRVFGTRTLMIVSDRNVAPLYLGPCREAFESKGFEVHAAVAPAGEHSKSPERLLWLYAQFYRAGLTRSDCVVALGGGMIGDLAGFAAATYWRGIPLILVPTTLLAQVDAAIGGKTAIDLPFGKNMVGAFYQPRLVVMDLDTLKTLEIREWASGMAEVVKYGCIGDEELFVELEHRVFCPQKGILLCVRLKAAFVERDLDDRGRRRLLNFGHTLGHALESATGFGRYYHGEAVAVGMVLAARIGEKLGVTEVGMGDRLARTLALWDLPVESPIAADRLLAAIEADKKWQGRTLQFVLIKRPGQAVLHPLSYSNLAGLLREVC